MGLPVEESRVQFRGSWLGLLKTLVTDPIAANLLRNVAVKILRRYDVDLLSAARAPVNVATHAIASAMSVFIARPRNFACEIKESSLENAGATDSVRAIRGHGTPLSQTGVLPDW